MSTGELLALPQQRRHEVGGVAGQVLARGDERVLQIGLEARQR